jgi:hypothetical protein
MSNNKHKNKALRELVKKEKRKFELEEKRLADTKTVEKMQEALKEYHKPDDVIFKIKNKSALKKVLKQNKKELTRKKYEVDKQVEIELVKHKAKIEVLNELIEEQEKLPTEEDIINSAKYIIHTEKRIIQTVKPIVLHLQEQGFSTENLDIAKILLETKQFQRGYFSKVWKMKKPNMILFYIQSKVKIFTNFVLGFFQKYLPKLYKLSK